MLGHPGAEALGESKNNQETGMSFCLKYGLVPDVVLIHIHLQRMDWLRDD